MRRSGEDEEKEGVMRKRSEGNNGGKEGTIGI